jgi:radical SAM superfamily enzyme YgiQ (UPF0313 family)
MSDPAGEPRLLLINPWIYDFTAFDLWSKPIGLLYIASYLRKIGYEISYIDCLDKFHPALLNWLGGKSLKVKRYGTGPFYREVVEKPAIFESIPRKFARYGMPERLFKQELQNMPKPDAILVTSFMTYWYLGPKKVIETVREVFPGVPVILGGIYATLIPEHAHRTIQPDYLIQGPGETRIEKLLSEIIPDAPMAENQPKALDDFPYPAFDLYYHLEYMPVMTSRGCPYRCTFCATDKISGKYAQRQPDKVVDEIIFSVKRYSIQDIAFYDDALLLNKNQRLLPILEMLRDKKLKIRFHTPNGLHAKQIDQKTAKLFWDSGFKTIRLSFETLNEKRQKDMMNKVTPSDLERAVQSLTRAGYSKKSLESYVLMGLPNQSFQEIYETILFVYYLGIKVKLASFSPIPGTVDYNRAVESGQFPADADPLLTNKTIYPLHQGAESYHRFQEIRQLVNILNQAIDREINLFSPSELRAAFHKISNGKFV